MFKMAECNSHETHNIHPNLSATPPEHISKFECNSVK